MSSEYMSDLTGLLGTSATGRNPSHNKKNNSVDLDMTDFLTLMVVQLQNQSIDDTADTSQMLNQMVQMQMITALTNMTDASVMSYASSLVGKEVTVVTYNGSQQQEIVVEVMGTGTYGGEQVIFTKDGDMYYLNEIMAVGRLPEPKVESDEDAANKPVDPVENAEDPEPAEETPADKPVESTEEGEEAEPETDAEDEPRVIDPPPIV